MGLDSQAGRLGLGRRPATALPVHVNLTAASVLRPVCASFFFPQPPVGCSTASSRDGLLCPCAAVPPACSSLPRSGARRCPVSPDPGESQSKIPSTSPTNHACWRVWGWRCGRRCGGVSVANDMQRRCSCFALLSAPARHGINQELIVPFSLCPCRECQSKYMVGPQLMRCDE
jgi:hypothetical protein